MKAATVILFLLLGYSFIQAQTSPLLEFKVDKNSDIALDNLNNIYIYNKNKIDKYTSKGLKLATYSNNQLGEIDKVDASNPLKTLVLHKDQNVLEILDNTLSTERNTTLDLTNANLYNTSAFTYSAIDNGIWFYDQEIFQIIKIDINLNRNYQSGNLLQLLDLDSLHVIDLKEYKNKLYLITPSSVLIFDNFGAYYSTIHLKNNRKVLSIEENTIFYATSKHIEAYNMLTFETQKIPIQVSNDSNLALKNNKLYSISEGIFSVFEIQ